MKLDLSLPDTPPDELDDLPDTPPDIDLASLPDTPPDDLDLPDTPPDVAPTRTPLEPQGWGITDTIKTALGATGEAVANTIPFVNQMVITDYEAAPAPASYDVAGVDVGKAGDVGADLVSGLGAGAVGALGGPIGLGLAGAADQLGRNAEDKRIEAVRAATAADPTISKQDADFEARKNLSLDMGDVGDAALAGVLNFAGGKIGQKVLGEGAEQLGRLGLLKKAAPAVAFDAAAGAAQGVSSTLNRENVGLSDIPEVLANPETRSQIVRDGVVAGALSLGGLGLQMSRATKVPETGSNAATESVVEPSVVQVKDGTVVPDSVRKALADAEAQGGSGSIVVDGVEYRFGEQPIDAADDIAAPIKEGYESGTLERPQDPTQVENEARSLALQAKVSGEPQIAKAINDALEGKPTTPEQRQMLRGLGLSPLSLRNRSLTKGASDGLQQREVQGETSSRPVEPEMQGVRVSNQPRKEVETVDTPRKRLNRQSQEIAATPEHKILEAYDKHPQIMTLKGKPEKIAKVRADIEADENPQVVIINGERVESAGYKRLKSEQAGMGVINLAGDGAPAAPGRPIGGLGLSAAPVAAREGINIDPTQARPYIKGKLSFETPDNATAAKLANRGANLRDEEGKMPKRVSGVNIEKIAPDDVDTQNIMAGLADVDADAINAQRGEFKDVLTRAAKIDKWKDLKHVESLKPNEVLNDENTISLDSFARGAVKQYAQNPTKENREIMQKYLKASAGVGSAEGRSLGARAIARREWLREAEPIDVAIVNTHQMFTEGGVDKTPDWVFDRFEKIKNPKDRTQILKALEDIKRKHEGMGGWWSRYRYFNMLSDLKTQGINAASNVTEAAQKMGLKEPIMHGLDFVAPGEKAYRPGQLPATYAGAVQGMKEGAERALFALTHGGQRIRSAKELDPAKIRPGFRGGSKNPANWPMMGLVTVDEAISSVGEGAARYSMGYKKAYDEAVEKGLSGKSLKSYVKAFAPLYAENDSVIGEAAMEVGKRLVHQEGPLVERIKASRKVPKGYQKAVNDSLNFIMPFWDIVLNLQAKGMKATGLGFVTGLMPKKTPWLGKYVADRTREQALEDVATATIGVTAAMWAAGMAKDGMLTAGVPDDPAEREIFYNTGKKPYSIWAGDTIGWLDYRFLGSLAFPLMAGANYGDAAIKHAQGKLDSTRLGYTAWKTAQSFIDLPILASISGIVDAIKDPKRGRSFVANLVTQFVPAASLQRELNRTGITDGTVPEANTVGERIQASTVVDNTGVPFLGLQPLAPKRNSLGKIVERNGEADPVFMEMERLGVRPLQPVTSTKVKGEPYSLTSEERSQIAATIEPVYDIILQKMGTKEYQEKPKEQQAAWFNAMLREKTADQPSATNLRSLGLSRLRSVKESAGQSAE